MFNFKESCERLFHSIDSGDFLRRPLYNLYRLRGVLSFLLVPCAIFVCASVYENYEFVLREMQGRYMLGCGVFIVVVTFIALFNTFFWFNRADQLQLEIDKGSRIVAIPLMGHYMQSALEIAALNLAVVGIACSVVGYLFVYLPVCFKMAEYIERSVFPEVMKGLFVALFVAAISCFFSYLGVMFARFWGESIRLKARMANDLRDIADITRVNSGMDEEEAAEEAAHEKNE